MPLMVISFLERIAAARAAVPFPWAMDSLICLGKWANPARNIPSLAKSSGLNLRCASRKNPSALSGTFRAVPSTWASGWGRTGIDNTSKSVGMVRSFCIKPS